MFAPQLRLTPEVEAALASRTPVVALESTIISHGMPYPENLRTAQEVEAIVRQEGAVPATIAVLDGEICVGLEAEALERFAQTPEVLKVSRRDLPVALSQGKSGGTTVAATMTCAHLAGIAVFVTGGIGGVHRDSEQTMDISADLTELARTPVAVVSAGVKSILDIPKTLEFLETHGVPVIGFRTSEFPAFFTPASGSPAQVRMDKPEDIARCMKTQWGLGLNTGLVIANPIPAEEAIDETLVQQAILDSLEEAKVQQITGKEVTPFLLERVNQRTQGRSLQSNTALIRNNARLGARIAGAYQRLA
ncbi:MAG: pseudouridine-5'-phosphate glycosidase [SAR324 cluster bacterium]|nr:pseudouridine-5'-phosphate glycosidase [SAR324 cluster bacterium]